MNEIKITHELCAEDRARLDRQTSAIEALTELLTSKTAPVLLDDATIRNMTQSVEPAEEPKNEPQEPEEQEAPATTPDEEEKPAQELKNEPQEPEEQETPATTPDEEEAPAEDAETATEAEEKPEEPTKPSVPVELFEIQQKVIALSAAGKKAEVKAIVTAYSDRVSSLPEDKWGEVLEQLTALEQTLEG